MRCYFSADSHTEKNSQSEAVEIPDPPIIEAAIAPIPIAQPTFTARIIENVDRAVKTDHYELQLMALKRGWDGSPFTLMRYAY